MKRASLLEHGCFAVLGMAMFAAWVSTAPPAAAHEVKQIWSDVRFADGSFEFTGASSAASTIMVFLPSFHCTQAFLDMLGENGVDRLDEIELACRENPRGLLKDLALPGVDAVGRAVRFALRRKQKLRRGEPRSFPVPPRRIVLRTNDDPLQALEWLGCLRFEPLPAAVDAPDRTA